MALPALDIPRLIERVTEIRKSHIPSDPANIVNSEANEDPFARIIKEELRKIIALSQFSDESYWKSANIRIESSSAFEACMKQVEKHTKLLGEGAFGKVLKIPANKCFKNVPSNVKHIGIKIEVVKMYVDNNQTPERLREVIKIGKKAGQLKIGPAVYDAFVVIGENTETKIIKTFEVIEGQPWSKVEWKTPKTRENALKKLEAIIKKMNNAGIIHHDLHRNNVMINTKGDIYIIDFDLAKMARNEESNHIGMFNSPMRWPGEVRLTDNSLNYIYDNLVKEGTIVLPKSKEPENIASNKKNKTRKIKR